MTDSLYLIEILVQEVVCDDEEIDKLNICVDVKLGQIADFSVQLEEKPDIFNIALVNPGKSFLFPASPYVLKHQLPQSKIQFTIKQPYNTASKNNVCKVLGETSMDWPISFRKLAERSEKSQNLLPESTNEKLDFNEEYGHTGYIKIFMRFSCFGHDIQTPYQVVQTKDEAMSYLFKGSKIPTPFKTQEYGHGGQKDLLPVGPLFSNKDRGKKRSNYSIDLTDSEIESSLCKDEECLAAYKFKEFGIGPLCKKKKEIISPCGGKTCQYAYAKDDPPCMGHRQCRFNTPQHSSMVGQTPNVCSKSSENNRVTLRQESMKQVPFKPYIITARPNYSGGRQSTNSDCRNNMHNDSSKFSRVVTQTHSDSIGNNRHVCQSRCSVPKRIPCCNNGHLRAGGEKNCCCDQQNRTAQTPEKPPCTKPTCKHTPKPPCCCKPPPPTCCKSSPPCGPPSCCKPSPPCGTPSCCKPPPCCPPIQVETLCLCPTICEDCGGYSRSGKTCKDLKLDANKSGFTDSQTVDDFIRIDNVKCFCNSGGGNACGKKCHVGDNRDNQISTQTEPNIIKNNAKVHVATSIESIISGKSNNESYCESIKSNTSNYKSSSSGQIKKKILNYEIKPPFERLKSGGVSPVTGKQLDNNPAGGTGDDISNQDGLNRPKRRKPTLVYDIGNNYPGNRVGHKTCILKIPQCPSKKGWEWSPEPIIYPIKPRKDYKPGFIPKDVQDIINDAREAHGLPVVSVRAPKKKKKKGKTSGASATNTAGLTTSSVVADDEDEGDEYEVDEKNTLSFQRKDGTYFIKMNPLRNPKTVKDNEDPYINCPPIEFTYTKDPLKKSMLGEDACDCCTCEDDENFMENDELNIDFSPPMGVVELERMKKAPNVVHFWTQYEVADIGGNVPRSPDGKKGAKGKGKKN